MSSQFLPLNRRLVHPSMEYKFKILGASPPTVLNIASLMLFISTTFIDPFQHLSSIEEIPKKYPSSRQVGGVNGLSCERIGMKRKQR